MKTGTYFIHTKQSKDMNTDLSSLLDALAAEVRARAERGAGASPGPDVSGVEVREGLEKYYTVAEVAQSLGVSRPTVYRLINNGILPITKIGACTRISAAAMDDAIGKGLTKKYRRL